MSAVVESAVPATSQRPAPVAVPAPAVAVAAPVVEASPRMPARRRPPLLGRPRVQRVVYPLLVGVVLVALWQIAVTPSAAARSARSSHNVARMRVGDGTM